MTDREADPDERLSQALHLIATGQATLARAAQHAELSLEELLEIVAGTGISVVDYPPSDLIEELEITRITEAPPEGAAGM